MPFGPNCEYKSFADCKRAHAGKKNPDGYCAELMRSTEEHCKKNKIGAVDLLDTFFPGWETMFGCQ